MKEMTVQIVIAILAIMTIALLGAHLLGKKEDKRKK